MDTSTVVIATRSPICCTVLAIPTCGHPRVIRHWLASAGDPNPPHWWGPDCLDCTQLAADILAALVPASVHRYAGPYHRLADRLAGYTRNEWHATAAQILDCQVGIL